MKRLFFVIFIFVLIVSHLTTPHVFAASQEIYQDYLQQFDQYRSTYNDFQITRNEYLKFKSLSAETSALQKTKEMMTQRALLLKTYFLLLNEKIGESQNFTAQERDFYVSSIKTANEFLDTHIEFINSVQSIKDAMRASQRLESQYAILQTVMRQVALTLNIARLRQQVNTYNDRMTEAKSLIEQAKQELPIEQHLILDRWFAQIGNKRTLYQQKEDQIVQNITAMKGKNNDELDKLYTQTLRSISEAQQELKEGTSFMNELANVMKYKD
jgi:hypothetical protein